MIPKELLEKYYMKDLDGYKQDFGDSLDTERMFYNAFLVQTDYIPLKIFESFIENMASASLLEMPSVILEFFKDVKITYVDVLTARKTAREKINEIEAAAEQPAEEEAAAE